jgi:hypothetical protein
MIQLEFRHLETCVSYQDKRFVNVLVRRSIVYLLGF